MAITKVKKPRQEEETGLTAYAVHWFTDVDAVNPEEAAAMGMFIMRGVVNGTETDATALIVQNIETDELVGFDMKEPTVVAVRAHR